MRYLIGVLVLTAWAASAFSAEPGYSWRSRPDDPDRAYLYLDGKQIGGWDYRARHYRTFDGTNWGPPTGAAPVSPPGQLVGMAQQPTVVVTVPPTVVVTQPLSPLPPLHGPPRVRLGTATGLIVADMTMKIFQAIPGAIMASLKQGNYQLQFQHSVTPTPEPSAVPAAPPVPVQPVQSPQRRWIIRR